jgi:tetratricopeptide (TPR) repeat protein
MGALAWGSLVCTLLPTLGLVQHGWEIHGADRYSYLPSMCMVPLHALALREAAVRLKLLASRRQVLFLSSCLVLTSVLMLKSHVSLRKWRSSEKLWKHAVAYGPSDAIAHYNMGCVLERYARDDENTDVTHKEEKRNLAMAMFTEALIIDPGYGAAHNNVGYLLEEISSSYWQKSEHHYREAIRLNPGHYTAHNNLGKLMHRTSRLEEAESRYRNALLLHPGYIKALYNIATLLHTTGGPSREMEAESLYRKAISLSTAGKSGGSKPQKLAEVYYNLAQMLGTRNGAGDPELIGLLRKALKIRPSYNRAQKTLDSLRDKMGAS